jgi:SAM-dependent methyltransferase
MTSASHRTSGFFRLLERPTAYLALQNLLGADSARRRFVEDFVRPFSGARIMDAGCGTGSLLDCLPTGVEYVGFDVNAAYIDSARRRYGHRGQFHCAGIEGGMSGEGELDLVVAVALLHHLDDENVHSLLGLAARALRPGGAFVSIDAVVHAGQSSIARALALADRGGRVRSPNGYRTLLEAHFEEVDDCVQQDMLRIPYSHYIARATARTKR